MSTLTTPIAPMGAPSALIDCLSANCTAAFKTFAEMAAHRLATHKVPLADTYADVDEPWPEEARPTAGENSGPGARRAAKRAETPAEMSENRMGRIMACGICAETGHRRETCPKRGPASPAAPVCGYCKKPSGTHRSGCPRAKGARKAAPARTAKPAPPALSPNGTGRYAAAIAELEAQAGELESKAKQARDLAGQLRAMA